MVVYLDSFIYTKMPNRVQIVRVPSLSTVTMSSLPSFLEPLNQPDATHLPYTSAIFRHKAPLAPVHALWWPCKQADSTPDIDIFFIPGKYPRDHHCRNLRSNRVYPRKPWAAWFLSSFPHCHPRQSFKFVGEACNTCSSTCWSYPWCR
jgi:hypothetical protein